jgi:hypothetical protein
METVREGLRKETVMEIIEEKRPTMKVENYVRCVCDALTAKEMNRRSVLPEEYTMGCQLQLVTVNSKKILIE